MASRAALSLLFLPLATLSAAQVTTFDGDTGGWGVFNANDGQFGDFLLDEGGNPGGNLEFRMDETFGVTLRNNSTASLLGDYGRFTQGVTLTADVRVDEISSVPLRNPVQRNLVVELVSYNPDGSDYPWTSVWTVVGLLDPDVPGWNTYQVTIADPLAEELPDGWGGYGAENEFAEPILPEGTTFADVLADVDEVRFTTFEPGYFYSFTNYRLAFDNVGVQPVPEPATLAALGAGTLLLLRRRRKG